MSLVKIPRRLVPHTIVWEQKLTDDQGWGDDEYAPPVEVPWVLTVDATEEEQATGATELVSSARVHTNGDPIISVGDRVTIWPGQPRERTETVEKVDHYEHPRSPTVDVLHLS